MAEFKAWHGKAMSKAFTKENDGDEQGGLLPDRAIPPYPNLVTADGLAQIEAIISQLTAKREAAVRAADTLTSASASRDLRYWNPPLATAALTESDATSAVQFGSRVTLKRAEGSTRTYRIVGTDEGDPSRGTLSYTSPLAQALVGQEVGDSVKVAATDAEIVAIT